MQGAVIEGRVAPGKERAALILAEFGPDQVEVDIGPLSTPVLDGGGVVGGRAVALCVGGGNDPAGPGDVPVADLSAHVDQLACVFALVQHEHDVRGVQLGDGLDREVFRVAGADAHYRDCPHSALRSPSWAGLRSRPAEYR